MADFKKLITVALKCVFMVTLVLITYALLLYKCMNFGQNSYHAAVLDKINLLERTASPKIVFVGGSSLAFGLDSSMVERAFGLPVVNMGLHVGLGLKFMLDQIQPSLNRNDIVVVIPEYEQFVGNLFYGGPFLVENTVITHDLHPVISMPPLYLANNLLKLNRHVFNYITHTSHSLNVNKVYARNSFNSYGDMTGHLKSTTQPLSKKYKRLPNSINLNSVKYLYKIINSNTQSGITTIIIYPSVAKSYYTQQSSQISNIYETLKHNGIKTELLPQSFVYSDSMFYDSHYHLNAEGRNIHTKKIIKSLETAIPQLSCLKNAKYE